MTTRPTPDQLMQALRDVLIQLAVVLEAIALHPDINHTPPAPTPQTVADTPPANKPTIQEMWYQMDKARPRPVNSCANCGTSQALDGWKLCYGCADDIHNESHEIGEPIMFSDEAHKIIALYVDDDDLNDGFDYEIDTV